MFSVAEVFELAEQFLKLAAKKKQVGTIYLIHFEEKIGDESNPRSQAQHYIGWTSDLSSRLSAHELGHGSSIMAFLKQSGIKWKLVRQWKGTRDEERLLKNQKNAKRYCPICSASPYSYLDH